MVMENAYDVLGVETDADDETLKNAYRKLARLYHPDVSPDPDSSAQFAEVTKAYRALSDADQRARIDEVVAELVEFNRRRPAPRGPETRGKDVVVKLKGDYSSLAEGGTREVLTDLAAPCPGCDSTGLAPGGSVIACPDCEGSGHRAHVQHTFAGDLRTWRPCLTCDSTGTSVDMPCGLCAGQGRVTVPHVLDVRIPAGMQDGATVCVRGHGNAGLRGGERGDLYVELGVDA